MVNEVNNGHNFTLNEFVTLANSTQNQNKELRIRKTTNVLSNKKLGFIAKTFGSTHKNSNISVNRAFIYSLKHEQKYLCIADKIDSLFTAKSMNQALTPNKVKATITTVDNILSKYETASNLANMAAENGLIAEGNDQSEFKNFVFDYLKKNPETNLSAQDFTAATTLEQKKAQISVLTDILSSFFEKTHAFENSPNFTLTDLQCNDAEKKNSIMNLLKNAVFYDNDHNKNTYTYFLKVNDNDLENLQGSPFNAFNGVQQKRIKSEFETKFNQDTDQFYLNEFSKEDIDKLDATLKKLNSQNEETPHLKKSAINLIGTLGRNIQEDLPDMDAVTRTKIMENFCKNVLDAFPNPVDPYELTAFLKTSYAESIIKNELIKEDNVSIFQKYDMSAEVGFNIIHNSDFGAKLREDIKEFKNHNDIKNLMTREISEFFKQNAYSLKILNTDSYVTQKNVQINNQQNNVVTRDLRQNVINAAVITKHISDILNSDQPQSPDLLLNSFIALNHQVKDLSGAETTKILDDVINNSITTRSDANGVEFLDEEEVLAILRKNRDNFDTLIRNIHSAAKDPKNAPIAKFLNETSALVEGFYNRCIINASEDKNFILDSTTTDEKYRGVYLKTTQGIPEPPPLEQINENGMQKAEANKLNFNASRMDIIVAEQRLNSNEKYQELSSKEKANIVDLMNKTSCDNIDFLYQVSHESLVYNTFTKGFKTLRIPGDSAYHHLNDLSDVGQRIKSVAKKTGIDIGSIRDFFIKSVIANSSREELETFYTELTNPRNVTEYEVLNTLSTKEMYEIARQGIAKGAKNMAEVYDMATSKSAEQIQISLNFANELKGALEEHLNKEKTGSLYNPGRQIPFTEVIADDLYQDELLGKFPNTVTKLDTSLAANKVQLNDKEMTVFTNFFNKLRIPGNSTIGDLSKDDSFEVKYKSINKGPDNRNKDLTAFFGKNTLVLLYAPYAKEICDLCSKTNNNPTPEQIWNLIHGGNAPENLTYDNLNEKMLMSLCAQTEAYGKMIGRDIDPSTMHLFFGYSGVPVFRYFEKMKDIATQDVTFSVADQKTSTGLFEELTNDNYRHGEENYGFGMDFHRARLPFGAYDPNKSRAEQDGITITVINNNETVTFSRKELMAHEDKHIEKNDHPYINKMVAHIDGLCKTKEQLAMVGTLTTQSTNTAFLTLHNYYREVAGGVLEHAANDFVITREGDNINVKIKSKPGTKYNYFVEYVVTPDGKSTIKEGTITLPKVGTLVGRGEEPYT